MRKYIMPALAACMLVLGLTAPAAQASTFQQAAPTSPQNWDWGKQVPAVADSWDWGKPMGPQVWSWGRGPAQNWDWGRYVSVPQAPASTTDATGPTGWKLGWTPATAKVCVANGYGPTAQGLVDNWNWPGYKLELSVRNICTGYSITNRMTIDSFSPVGGSCFALTNTHRTRDVLQTGAPEIWDQNVVLWINVWGGCWANNIQLYHRIQMYMGHVLGLNLNGTGCQCIMGIDSWSLNNVPYVTAQDALDMNRYVYDR
jgi:hypothetical protein